MSPEPRPTKPEGGAPERHVPERTCIGCRTTRPAFELIRFVRRADGSVVAGPTMPGRGAWLCRASPSCLEQAIRKGGFARAFRAPVTADSLAALHLDLDVPTR